MTFCSWLKKVPFRSLTFVICCLTPFLLLPLALSPYKSVRCAYVVLWMAVYWILEPVHMAVTSLLPVVLMPTLGILPAEAVCQSYMKEVVIMYIGGLAVALAVEYSHLHERIALKVLLLLGSDTKWLMMGFMLTSMFLSMWISNTATTAMMTPIVDAVMTEISTGGQDASRKTRNLHTILLLSVAYSANCGGTGTITGTSPNMIFKGLMEEMHPKSVEITFASWMLYNVPGMVLCVLSGWLLIQILHVPCWKSDDIDVKRRLKEFIRHRHKLLGKISFHEIAVLILFVLLVLLWTFRDPKFMPGWIDLFPTQMKIGNAVPVIFVLFLLFLVPAEPHRLHSSSSLLEWQTVQTKLPWGLSLLMGGGFALAEGTQASGLSDWLGQQLLPMSTLPRGAVLVILCLLTTSLTEIISNSTVATILLPVVSQMAITFNVNPLYLMIPVTISCSYAFMLPVAAGPNAIVFDNGPMKTMDMVKAGISWKIVSCLIQIFMINTLGIAMFDLNSFPLWANQTLS